MKWYSILCVLICIINSSCNKFNGSDIAIGKTIFSYDSINSKLVDLKFKYDSLLIERISSDSMKIIRYSGGEGFFYHSKFSFKNNIFYENRIIPQLVIEGETKTSVILIPTFLQRDTIFDYLPEDDFFSVFVKDLSFDKCKYQIKKNSNEFLTIKQSLIDTTYKEIFFYDKNYNIYKFVNTWKDNRCVYVKKE